MSSQDIVVIGGSAGGLHALREILARTPAHLPVAMFAVLHRGLSEWGHSDTVTESLAERSLLRVCRARDLELFQTGTVYVCPPDYHLYLENGCTRVEKGPKESRFRPSIDVLFRSAAAVYGRRTVGVLLSGASGIDGVAGLWRIKQRGGVALVQEPSQAMHSDLPRDAIAEIGVDLVLPVEEIGLKLVDLVGSGRRMRTVRILIVEDERIVAKNLEERLVELDYQLLASVSSGEAAIEVAELRPDIVLMDIKLSGELSGIDAARQIWAKYQIPIVYVTSYADRTTLEEVKSTESYGYVVKPFHSEAIHAVLELALDRREKEMRHL